MKKILFWMIALVVSFTSASVYPDQVAGVFQWPFALGQKWTCTSTTGSDQVFRQWKRDQYFMQWNPDFKKYHLAEDWNGVCGGSTDRGAPLYALADGKVVGVDTRTKSDSIG